MSDSTVRISSNVRDYLAERAGEFAFFWIDTHFLTQFARI